MYDWPETSEVLDRFWNHISASLRTRGIQAPDCLDRTDDLMSAWLDPELIIGQTCGWPYANLLGENVHLFGCFDHGLRDCKAGEYYSIFIGRDAEDKSLIRNKQSLASAESVAVNLLDSQSGFHVFSEISGLPALKSIPEEHRVMTGSHLSSIEAVATGKAQIGAVDAVSFEMAGRYYPKWVEKIEILGQSRPRPALPLVTSRSMSQHEDVLVAAITHSISKLNERERETLMIRDFIPKNGSDYRIFKTEAS